MQDQTVTTPKDNGHHIKEVPIKIYINRSRRQLILYPVESSQTVDSHFPLSTYSMTERVHYRKSY